MPTVKVSSKNQIAVPAAVRRQLGIKPGDRLRVEVKEHRLILEPERDDAAARLASIAPDIWQGMDAQDLVNGLRDEWSDRGL